MYLKMLFSLVDHEGKNGDEENMDADMGQFEDAEAEH